MIKTPKKSSNKITSGDVASDNSGNIVLLEKFLSDRGHSHKKKKRTKNSGDKQSKQQGKLIAFPAPPEVFDVIPFSADELRAIFGAYSYAAASHHASFLLQLDSSLTAIGFFRHGDFTPYLRLIKVANANGDIEFAYMDKGDKTQFLEKSFYKVIEHFSHLSEPNFGSV